MELALEVPSSRTLNPDRWPSVVPVLLREERAKPNGWWQQFFVSMHWIVDGPRFSPLKLVSAHTPFRDPDTPLLLISRRATRNYRCVKFLL